jgi:hypothetical protein
MQFLLEITLLVPVRTISQEGSAATWQTTTFASGIDESVIGKVGIF